ncbi:CreA [Chromobacterium sp. LK11]|uniref:CreA family protein n=1 Tax=Chromobacterium sp. LK11 TaxID=1628212 RepID=UPI000654AEA9|nr:CreA family protein [Chromobacterium sp. LK11]KMN76250.1 CreA [Chromobacterium sp. LK11]
MKKTALLLLACLSLPAWAEEVGEVSTTFKLLSPNDKVVVEAFDDPAVQGVACYISRAKTGGYKGALGLAKDPSRFSVACRQVGAIKFAQPLPKQEQVFKEGASFIFKHVRVVRIVDAKRNTLTYLSYSDKLLDGSPDNALTAVAVLDQKIPLRP